MGHIAIEVTLDSGSQAFAGAWRGWMAQWTQPQLLKIAETYLGGRLFHSSQMGGFASRKLRNPAPTVFLAVGYLNRAHAFSLGWPPERIEDATDIGLPQKLPEALQSLYINKEPLVDAEGIALGPTGLFEAFCGLLPLPVRADRSITPEQEAAASETVGRYLRLRLPALDIDWLQQLPELRQRSSVIEELLMGKKVQGDRLLGQLRALAAIANTTDDELWAQIDANLPT